MAGVENVAPLLHALVLVRRPRRILEVGAGHSTFYLAAAALEVAGQMRLEELGQGAADASLLAGGSPRPAPRVVSIDDGSGLAATPTGLRSGLEEAGLMGAVELLRRDFRGFGRDALERDETFDFIWFDCGGPEDYEDFLEEFWPALTVGSGLLAMHYTQVELEVETSAGTRSLVTPSPLLNMVRRAQLRAGRGAPFESLTLVEPHKRAQGSITLVQKLGSGDAVRDAAYEDDAAAFYGRPARSVAWP